MFEYVRTHTQENLRIKSEKGMFKGMILEWNMKKKIIYVESKYILCITYLDKKSHTLKSI